MAQAFRKAYNLSNVDLVRWFPGHMGKGLRQMQQKLKMIDCVIEVHDCRIPFSGRNRQFKHTVSGVRPHILVLNKKDIGDERTFGAISKRIKEDEGINDILFTNCKDQQCSGVKRIVPTVQRLINDSDRYNRSEQSEYNIMIIGVPNVGKSSLTNVLRNKHLHAKKATTVGAVAGVTRSVLTRIKISDKPLTYIFDTPGILEPYIRDAERGMKLASVSCLQDHLVGETVIADYLLYWLNKNNHFAYVDWMNLPGPTDNIQDLLIAGTTKYDQMQRLRLPDGRGVLRPDFDYIARQFIRAFRHGDFGRFNLDHDFIEQKQQNKKCL